MAAWYYGTGDDSFGAEFSADGTPTGQNTHGSRVIWRASTQVGCSVSKCPGSSNDDSNFIMCHFGNGVSWNQVSKPGTCNPDKQDTTVNLGKPLGHTPPNGGTDQNTFPIGTKLQGAGSSRAPLSNSSSEAPPSNLSSNGTSSSNMTMSEGSPSQTTSSLTGGITSSTSSTAPIMQAPSTPTAGGWPNFPFGHWPHPPWQMSSEQ